MVDYITKQKRDIYTIVGTNTSKNLVYQLIFIITNSSVLILLLTIIFIEDQINYSLHYHTITLTFEYYNSIYWTDLNMVVFRSIAIANNPKI